MGYLILSLFILLISVVLIRTLAFRPKAQPQVSPAEVSFDEAAAVESLAALIRCKTISCNDSGQEDDAEFDKLTDALPVLYPNVFHACSLQKFPSRGLLFHWPGKECGAPSVFMAHYDVVSVQEHLWEKPPFAGIVENGVLWGRGALDTKVTMNSALFAANHLIAQGFVPQNDIYFAFSGNEEINGNGARNIVAYFETQGIRPALVVDEGGGVVENAFPGVKGPCAMIGIAEKGLMNVQYTVHSKGGHASAPPAVTPLTTLAKACNRIVKHPFKLQLSKATAEMFNTLGRHASFGYRLVYANLWLFKPVLDLLGRKNGGDLNAFTRTTVAFTQAQGSQGRNVIPSEATLVSNMRLNATDTVDSAIAYLKNVVNDPSVEIFVLETFEPSPVSETGCESWDKVAGAVSETWRGCIVSPFLMVQCSDSRHYGKISKHVYRFSAMDLTTEERRTIHGNNERIRLDVIKRSVEFYIRLIGKC